MTSLKLLFPNNSLQIVGNNNSPPEYRVILFVRIARSGEHANKSPIQRSLDEYYHVHYAVGDSNSNAISSWMQIDIKYNNMGIV